MYSDTLCEVNNRVCIGCGNIFYAKRKNSVRCVECKKERRKLLPCIYCGKIYSAKHVRSGLCRECNPELNKSTKNTYSGRSEDPRAGFIYVLKHPTTNEVRYVGKTGQTIRERYNEHKNSAKNKRIKAYLYSWWRKVARETGKLPVIDMIQRCEAGTLNKSEQLWIDEYRKTGARLTNTQRGGGGSGWSEEKKIQHSKECAERNRKIGIRRRLKNLGLSSEHDLELHDAKIKSEKDQNRRDREDRENKRKHKNLATVAISIKGKPAIPVGMNGSKKAYGEKKYRQYWWITVHPKLYEIANKYRWHTKYNKSSGLTTITARTTINGKKTLIGSIANSLGISGNFYKKIGSSF